LKTTASDYINGASEMINITLEAVSYININNLAFNYKGENSRL
jgi:hypothetical protein